LRFLIAAAEAGAPPLAALAGQLQPPAAAPWYEAGRADSVGPGPETLMGPLVVWSRAWHGRDAEALVAAAFSVARLTHAWPEALSTAVSFALALFEVGEARRVPSDLASRIESRSTV